MNATFNSKWVGGKRCLYTLDLDSGKHLKTKTDEAIFQLLQKNYCNFAIGKSFAVNARVAIHCNWPYRKRMHWGREGGFNDHKYEWHR